ncbi:hypothetical protein DIE17_04000 [Burkholderia sp. Bp9099]|nr:hypothetical protein DIE17_04000 [Burkholderia sp. Bp9099]
MQPPLTKESIETTGRTIYGKFGERINSALQKFSANWQNKIAGLVHSVDDQNSRVSVFHLPEIVRWERIILALLLPAPNRHHAPELSIDRI